MIKELALRKLASGNINRYICLSTYSLNKEASALGGAVMGGLVGGIPGAIAGGIIGKNTGEGKPKTKAVGGAIVGGLLGGIPGALIGGAIGSSMKKEQTATLNPVMSEGPTNTTLPPPNKSVPPPATIS